MKYDVIPGSKASGKLIEADGYEDRKDPKTTNRRKQPKEPASQEDTNKRREAYLRDGSR